MAFYNNRDDDIIRGHVYSLLECQVNRLLWAGAVSHNLEPNEPNQGCGELPLQTFILG